MGGPQAHHFFMNAAVRTHVVVSCYITPARFLYANKCSSMRFCGAPRSLSVYPRPPARLLFTLPNVFQVPLLSVLKNVARYFIYIYMGPPISHQVYIFLVSYLIVYFVSTEYVCTVYTLAIYLAPGLRSLGMPASSLGNFRRNC